MQSSKTQLWQLLLCLFLTPLLCAQEAKQAAQLQVADLFDLTKQMQKPYARPQAWLDEEHYLAIGHLKPKGPPLCLAVEASTGKAKVLVDPNAMVQALAGLPGFDEQQAIALVVRPRDFQFNKDHSALLLNTAADLFHYDLQSKQVRRLTQGPSEEVGEAHAPNGKMVAFVQDYNLHVVDLMGGRPRPLTAGGHKDLLFGRLDWVYQEELYGRGNFKGFWWSPKSTHLAFLRLDESPVQEFTLVSDVPTRPKVEVENYPKAGDANPEVSLGVVPVRGGEPLYFDLSHYGTQDLLISRVAWHPDGSEVYFQVQDRQQTWLDLLAGKVGEARPRLVLHEGSDCWVEAKFNPHWLADGDQFLWLSERDGFQHIYLYNRDGTLHARLSVGEYEVDEILNVDEENKQIHVLSDRGDWKEQHLWRLSFDGKTSERITKRGGWHRVTMSPMGSKYWDHYSNALYMGELVVAQADGSVLSRAETSDMQPFNKLALPAPEFVQVKNRNGFQMEAMLIKPLGFKEGQAYPTLCYTYSGPHAPSVKNAWGRFNFLWHQLLAQRGYLIWICDNRSASGQGRQSAAACYKKMGQTELQDLEDGVKWLIDKGYANPKRIGIWGWSYGGYQTSYCLTHSKVWSMGMAVNPVTDHYLYDSIYTERYMGLPQTNKAGYDAASVNQAAKDLHGELLLVAASMDDNVHMQNSLQFAHALQQAGKSFQFMVYPRLRHSIGNKNSRVHLYQMMTDFVEANL